MPTQTYFLQQQTPLIHFQSEQAGAGLRATEVKPALDIYLTKQYAGKIPAGWKIGFGHNQNEALNYKMKLSGGDYNTWQIETVQDGRRPKQFPLFFANMGSPTNEHKYFLFSEKMTQLVIQSQVPELGEFISQHIGAFFASHNFMTRKTKGFGSFILADQKGRGTLPQSRYSFTVQCDRKVNKKQFQRLFEDIEILYKALRSGINLKGKGFSDKFYFKSLLFQYAKTKDQQWDKRKMRRDLFGEHPKFRQMEPRRTDEEGTVRFNKGEARLYRDMLGLASETQWFYYDRANVKKESDKVDRYPSPITFKPVHLGGGRFEVYILTRAADEKMRDREFMVSSTYRHKKTRLRTPTAEKFNIDEYLRFAFSYFDTHDFEKYIAGDDRQADTLYRILKQLSAQ